MNMEIKHTPPVLFKGPDQFLWSQCITMAASMLCEAFLFSAATCIGLFFTDVMSSVNFHFLISNF